LKENNELMGVKEEIGVKVRKIFEEEGCGEKEVYELIFEIICQRSTGDKAGEFPELMTLFVRFNCKMIDGSLMRVELITKICAKLIFLIKLTILEKVMEGEIEERENMIKSIICYARIDYFNVFSQITGIKRRANRIAKGSNKLPTITFGDGRGGDIMTIYIKGTKVSAEDLRHCYSLGVKKSKGLIEKLLMGLEVKLDSGNIYDNFCNSSVGYQMQANKNVVIDERIRSSLLKYIMENLNLKKEFVVRIVEGKIEFDSGKARDYIREYDEYIVNLLVAVHIGSGMPARATELETYCISNGISSIRTVYYNQGQIMFYVEYSKTRAFREANRNVVRFMDEEMSEVLLKDLMIVRPFVTLLGDFLKIDNNETYKYDMFVIDGQKVESQVIRNIFTDKFYEYTRCPINFSDYRQVVKYFANLLKIRKNEGEESSDSENDKHNEDEEIDILDDQFGHSKSIANQHYGNYEGEMRNMRGHIVYKYKKMINIWHRFLKEKRKKKNVTDVDAEAVEIAHSQIEQGYQQQQISDHYCEDIQSIMNINSSSNSNGINIRNQKPRLVEETKKMVMVDNEHASHALLLLKEFYGDVNDSRINFKSVEQQTSIEYVLNTDVNMLVILPTGCGKSLLFFMYAYKYRHLVSIVVVSTVSLKQDLKMRGEKYRIRSCTDIEKYTNENLILITPEGARSEKFKLLAVKMFNTKRLGKIFIDEAHMISTDYEYRPAFRELVHLMFFSVPIVLMTGTGPRWIEEDIKDNFFGELRKGRLYVIRQETNRLNIRYEVEKEGSLEKLITKCKEFHERLGPEERMIIYVVSIDQVRIIKASLEKNQIRCESYHGKNEDLQNARIDYSSVRYVICYGLPYSLEDYVQQTGRSGRDGKASYTVLLANMKEEEIKLKLIEKETSRRAKRLVIEFANNAVYCRRRILSRYFDGREVSCSHYEGCVKCEKCEKCDICSKVA
jgi:hypothetical protein